MAAAERAAELAPKVPEAHSVLGMMLWQAGDRTRAASAFHEALRLRPSDTEAAFWLDALSMELDRQGAGADGEQHEGQM
jgi:Flp pilus assembly protein TadD